MTFPLLHARLQGQSEWSPASLEWAESQVVLHYSGQSVATPFTLFANGERDLAQSLCNLAAQNQIELRGCLNCLHNRASGLSSQFSDGLAGYCNLAGFRQRDAIVHADFLCSEHQRAPGWPEDPQLTYTSRQNAAQIRPSRLAAFQGALVGHALGDALSGGHPGVITDITRASNAVADSLRAARPPEALQTTAAHMVPVGLLYWRNRPLLLENARAIARGSSNDVETGVAVALLVALALKKRSPSEMFDVLMTECGSRSEEFCNALRKLSDVVDDVRQPEDPVARALYSFRKSPLDFQQTVLAAANFDASPHVSASIAGAISGAFNGLESIPLRWRDRLPDTPELLDRAARLDAASLNFK